ncbi:hypothetical protein N7461_005444 [Penicillium sp. DV-2018c]|nr:hypothetical protein N7461_005444 [Penicillium sp. DV-2018c]
MAVNIACKMRLLSPGRFIEAETPVDFQGFRSSSLASSPLLSQLTCRSCPRLEILVNEEPIAAQTALPVRVHENDRPV